MRGDDDKLHGFRSNSHIGWRAQAETHRDLVAKSSCVVGTCGSCVAENARSRRSEGISYTKLHISRAGAFSSWESESREIMGFRWFNRGVLVGALLKLCAGQYVSGVRQIVGDGSKKCGSRAIAGPGLN